MTKAKRESLFSRSLNFSSSRAGLADLATKAAVLSTMALMAGGGRMMVPSGTGVAVMVRTCGGGSRKAFDDGATVVSAVQGLRGDLWWSRRGDEGEGVWRRLE